MLYLLLAICSSAMISIMMRISSEKVSNGSSVLFANYLVCLLLAFAYAGFRVVTPGAAGFAATVGMGAVNGALYLAGFVLLQVNTRKNGIVLSSIFMKLGLLVPMVASIFLFREMPTALQALGFLLAIGAIVIMNFDKNAVTADSKLGLIILLLTAGTCDTMAKVYEALGSKQLSDQYLFYTFTMAVLLGLGLMVSKKERLSWKALFYGMLIGIPNFFCAKFLLKSLEVLPGVIVYPTYSVATILLVTLVGVLAFRERLGKRQWIGLAVILAALAMLNV